MPLTEPLSALKSQLRMLITDDHLHDALTICSNALPEGSRKHNLIVGLFQKLNDLYTEYNHKGTIDFPTYRLHKSVIVASLLDLIAEFQEVDFDETSQTVKRGCMLYQIPKSMPLKETTECIIRVAIDELSIAKDLNLEEEGVNLKTSIEISEVMRAELKDFEGNVFSIKSFDKYQKISPTGYTQWRFSVKPLVEGEHKLLVKVSVMEFDDREKKYIPRSYSVIETVTVIVATQIRDEEVVPFKSSEHSFLIGPASSKSNIKIPVIRRFIKLASNFSRRTIALLLAVLMITTSVLATPRINRSWWITTLNNTTGAYDSFIKHNLSRTVEGKKHPLIEKAYFLRAERSNRLIDFREYQNSYGDKGKFTDKVLAKIAVLEWKSVRSIQEMPTELKIIQYLKEFPDATRLYQIVEVLKSLPEAQRGNLMARIEDAYVQTIEQRPTARKVKCYSRNFPELSRLKDIAKAAAKDPNAYDAVKELSKNKIGIVIEPEVTDSAEVSIDTSDGARISIPPIPPPTILPQDTNTINPRVRDIKIPFPDMVSIKGGKFMMGDVLNDKEFIKSETVHEVTVSDFFIARNELTFEEYELFCKKIKRTLPSDERWGQGNRPVIYASWIDAINYCNWLSESHSLQPVYSINGSIVNVDWNANGFRLPTEAEWEYAARGGGKMVRFGNDQDLADPAQINFDGKKEHKKPYSIPGIFRSRTLPVGTLKSPNELGINDMSGNVYEWCWDWDSPYPNSAVTNPTGGAGTKRIVRGGSWKSRPGLVRAAFRGSFLPEVRSSMIGFRLARGRQ